MMVAKQTIPGLVRGLWCNMCGTRLPGVGAAGPGVSASAHRVEWREPSGRVAGWCLCARCYQERLRCAACGLHVGEQAVMIEGERYIYCRYCFEVRPRCDTCSRPVGMIYWTRPDGRTLCDRCQSTAVSDPAHAYALYRRVRADLARWPGMTLSQPCQLKLVSRRQLVSLIEKSSLHSLDADSRGRCFGLFIREGDQRTIFVEYGLPQIVLLEVLAHEYAHAWQSEHCPPEDIPQVQEGFAEWVAYRLLEGWGCKRRSQRMLRRDDIYGRGLKLMLQWEQEVGIAGVFHRVREPLERPDVSKALVPQLKAE